MHYEYRTSGTCSQVITFDINGNVITNIKFIGGCNGNLKAIAALVDGWTVDQIVDKLSGISCGWKSTSCGDQLAKAVKKAYEETKNQ